MATGLRARGHEVRVLTAMPHYPQWRVAGLDNLTFVDPLSDTLYAKALRAADVLLVNDLPGSGQMAVPSKLTSYFGTGVPVVTAVEAGGTTAYE